MKRFRFYFQSESVDITRGNDQECNESKAIDAIGEIYINDIDGSSGEILGSTERYEIEE